MEKVNKWRKFNKLTDKYIKYAGLWHLETCAFPHEDSAVCNCEHTKIKKKFMDLIIS